MNVKQCGGEPGYILYACRGVLMTETAGFALRCALHAVIDCATARLRCMHNAYKE